MDPCVRWLRDWRPVTFPLPSSLRAQIASAGVGPRLIRREYVTPPLMSFKRVGPRWFFFTCLAAIAMLCSRSLARFSERQNALSERYVLQSNRSKYSRKTPLGQQWSWVEFSTWHDLQLLKDRYSTNNLLHEPTELPWRFWTPFKF